MDKFNKTTINSLLPHNEGSGNFDSDLNTLRRQFDSNFEKWKTLLPGDPNRRKLVIENERLLGLILDPESR